MLVLRLRDHLDAIALTGAEVGRLVEVLLAAADHSAAAEAVADVLESSTSDDGAVGFPLTELEVAALLQALNAIGADGGELSTGLALLRQELESDAS